MASNASAIRAGRAFVELFADDSRLVRGLNAASARLKAWGASVTALGKAAMLGGMSVLGPLTGTAKVFADMGSEMADLSQRTGVSVEALSELRYAAEMSGADLGALESGLRKMQKTLVTAASGSQSAQESLGALGVTVGELQSLAPDEQFALIAARLGEITDPAQRTAAALAVFGKAGTQLLPMMADGAAGLDAMRQQARDLGLVMSSEDAASADALGDALDALWKTLKMGVFAVGSAVAPLLTDLAQRAAGVIKTVTDWIKQNRALIVTVFKIATAVAAGGAAFIALGGVISGIGVVLGTLASIATGVGTALGVIGTVLGAVLSPVGLAITALASLAGTFIYVSGTGQQVLSWLGQQFAALRDTALAAWQGISDALAAGDIALAAKVLWLTLKMEWQKGVAAVNRLWETAKWYFFATWKEATSWLAEQFIVVWAGVKSGFVQTIAFMTKAWHGFVLYAGNAWNTAQMKVGHVFLDLLGKLGVLSEQEVGWAQADLSRQLDAKIADRTREREAAIAEVEAQQQQDLARVRGERADALAALAADKQRYYDKLNAAYDADVANAQAAVEAAKAEWQASLEAARNARAAESAPTPGKRPELAALPDIGAAIEKVTAAGTFSAFGAQALAAGGPQERTARATEETARNTKQLLNAVRDGRLAFE